MYDSHRIGVEMGNGIPECTRDSRKIERATRCSLDYFGRKSWSTMFPVQLQSTILRSVGFWCEPRCPSHVDSQPASRQLTRHVQRNVHARPIFVRLLCFDTALPRALVRASTRMPGGSSGFGCMKLVCPWREGVLTLNLSF